MRSATARLDLAVCRVKRRFKAKRNGSRITRVGTTDVGSANNEYLVNFKDDGKEICDYIDNTPGARVKSNGRVINRDKYFREGITWTYISAAYFGVRYSPNGFIFDVAGSTVFPSSPQIPGLLGFMSSMVADYYIKAINPTMNIQAGNVGKLPVKHAFD